MLTVNDFVCKAMCAIAPSRWCHSNCFATSRWDEPMEPPAGTDTETVGIGQWRAGMTFGEFSEATMAKYYGTS